jgi:hypothetical protein
MTDFHGRPHYIISRNLSSGLRAGRCGQTKEKQNALFAIMQKGHKSLMWLPRHFQKGDDDDDDDDDSA